MGYRLTAQAEADFDNIYYTGVREFGPAQGDAYPAGMQRVFDFLSDFPRAARERQELKQPVRAHPYKSHVIVYRIIGESDDILIVRIRNSREDWLSHPT